MTEEPGQLIAGRYQLGRCLARGGMGSVWEAEHVELEARVAVKLLRPELGEDATHIERFRREARAAAKLKSPHVVHIYDCGVDRGTPYIAMEFLEGEDLELRLGRLGRLELAESFAWLDQAARGLAVAHAAGLVHRDVKPANLFIERLPTGERLKVVDFGIARPLSGDGTLTTHGGVWGSPAYMSPEQARGRAVDQRTDVWALAGVFYRCLTGSLPFPGLTEHDTIVLVCTGKVRPPSAIDADLPPGLDELFVRAFAQDPAERTPSVEVLAAEAAEVLGERLSAFDVPPSRPSTPALSVPTRSPHAGPAPGRVTETKPLGGDTGPAPVTAHSKSSEPSPSRRLGLGLLVAAVLALGGAFLWPKAEPKADATKDTLRPQSAGPQSEHGGYVAAPPESPTGNSTEQQKSETAPATQPAPARMPTPSDSNQKAHPGRAGQQNGGARKNGQQKDRQKSSPPAPDPSAPPADAPRGTDPLFGLPLEGNDAK